MTEICMCVKIHIPAVLSNYRFTQINLHHRYYDDAQLKEQTLKFYSGTARPFLEFVNNMAVSSNHSFKVGISVSGIALSLIKRFVPEFFEKINHLRQENIIELLSESWSNSYLAFGYNKMIIRQIALHDIMMNSLFGIVPETFLAPVPVVSDEIISTIHSLGKKRILTYSNHMDKKDQGLNNRNEKIFSDEYREYLINFKAGQLLQEIDYNPDINRVKSAASLYSGRFLKYLNGYGPQVVTFDPGKSKVPFLTGISILLGKIFSNISGNSGIRFVFPSELGNRKTPKSESDAVSGQVLNSAKIPDVWLTNNLQKDAYSRILSIHKQIYANPDESLAREWDFLHDMEHLYYMSSLFSDTNYQMKHFSPYSSPYLAYINYLNVLDDFEQRVAMAHGEQTQVSSIKYQVSRQDCRYWMTDF